MRNMYKKYLLLDRGQTSKIFSNPFSLLLTKRSIMVESTLNEIEFRDILHSGRIFIFSGLDFH